ncbi:MAG: UDP-N-acetylglucosamine 2-epimerase (hydrolyzing) [Candidatus Vogelbacteria bacterium]|nr:UDP-N-acetylglucosamine 2-epimerase (hydrolyzing) [Candidatus Vogelbacteria bacterium]
MKKSAKKQNRPRTLCVFSGKRGGLGAYVKLMRLIEDDSELRLQILLSDMHASATFGRTADEARKLFPKARIEVLDMGTGVCDEPAARAENLGKCLSLAARALERLAPDIVIVHADRAEHLMVALAAIAQNIPVAHTQGGEISGNIDDTQRHAISKLAHIHFPETRKAAKILRALGEEPWRIHETGSVYVDRIVAKNYRDPRDACRKYRMPETGSFAIVIYHPETLKSREENYRDMRLILDELEYARLPAIIMYPCSDPGYDGIIRAIEEKKGSPLLHVHKNIEAFDFHGLLANASFIVGNSSSALVEAPYFKLPAINIGIRQIGRTRNINVLDITAGKKAIRAAINKCINDGAFRERIARARPHLGDGHASEKIIQILKKLSLDERLLEKKVA